MIRPASAPARGGITGIHEQIVFADVCQSRRRTQGNHQIAEKPKLMARLPISAGCQRR
jgi:hypothetical protein